MIKECIIRAKSGVTNLAKLADTEDAKFLISSI